jgi:osmoprotectant transport system ATP-binding protein
MIRLEGVTRLYGDAVAVDDLSFEVPEGEVCVLIGPSGCGKTTTLRMINRLVEPTSGRILIEGRDITSLPVEDLRRGLGYVIQSVGLFPHLTVAGNIAVVPRLLGWDAARIAARVDELLGLVGLLPEEFRNTYPRQLSGCSWTSRSARSTRSTVSGCRPSSRASSASSTRRSSS